MTGIIHNDHNPAATSGTAFTSTPAAATPALTPPDRPAPFPAVGASPTSANGAVRPAPEATPITPDLIDRPYGAPDLPYTSLVDLTPELSAARGMPLTVAVVESAIRDGKLPGTVVLIDDRPHVTLDDADAMLAACRGRRAA